MQSDEHEHLAVALVRVSERILEEGETVDLLMERSGILKELGDNGASLEDSAKAVQMAQQAFFEAKPDPKPEQGNPAAAIAVAAVMLLGAIVFYVLAAG